MNIEFLAVPADVVERKDLSPEAKLVFGRIRLFSGKPFFPKYAAKDIGMSEEVFVSAFEELVRAGLAFEHQLKGKRR